MLLTYMLTEVCPAVDYQSQFGLAGSPLLCIHQNQNISLPTGTYNITTSIIKRPACRRV